MLSNKRRPTSSVKHSSKNKLDPPSVLTHKRMPKVHDLLMKKYFLPVQQEDDRHRAFQITRFLAGILAFIEDLIQKILWDLPNRKNYTVNSNG